MLKLLFAALVMAQIGVPPPMGPRVPPDTAVSTDGIRVRGAGYATAPATDAQVTLQVSSRNNAPTLDAQTLQPIIDALVKAGADRSSISLPPYMVGQAHTNNASIAVRVHHPTQAMLQQGMLTIASAFAAHPEFLLNAAQVQLTADGCTALRRSAEAMAIAHARSNAAFVAQQLGEKIGSALEVDDFSGPNFGPESDACSTTYTIAPYANQQMTQDDMLTVKVYSSVTVRFAIKRSG